MSGEVVQRSFSLALFQQVRPYFGFQSKEQPIHAFVTTSTGIVRKVHFDSGSIVQVGETLVTIETTDEDEDDDGVVPAETTALTSSVSGPTEWESEGETDDAPHKVLTSPAVRALARQHDLDLRRVVATGPKGRMTKGDVMAYLDSLQASGPTTVAEEVVQEVASTEAESLPTREVPEVKSVPDRSSIAPPVLSHETTTIPLRGYRKAMVKSMSTAATIPHFHFCEEVQVRSRLAVLGKYRVSNAV